MGLINQATYETANGIQKTATYISFNNETIYLSKRSTRQAMNASDSNNNFIVRANYRIFWDKPARDAGKSFIELKTIETEIAESALSSSLYGVLYARLKEVYPGAVDEI
jgi:hypothetical protein